MRTFYPLLAGVVVWACCPSSSGIRITFASDSAATNKSTADVDAKVEALLAQMTLDEKIGQMTQVDSEALKDKADVKKYFLGSVLSGGTSDPPKHDNTGPSWAKF